MIVRKIISALKQTKPSQLRLNREKCSLCGWKLQIKTHNDEMGVRCSKCFASPVAQSLGRVFKQFFKPDMSVYELSSRGAFVRFLQKQNRNLTLSEYIDEIKPGEYKNGIQCQNVEKLTLEDNCFDICTSLEVFEHVENDIKGFKEVYRVLKPNGVFIFTVPIILDSKTIERTQVVNGKRINILPPEYHSDSLRGKNKVFCYRNYGVDILQQLSDAGFKSTEIIKPNKKSLFGYARPILVARK